MSRGETWLLKIEKYNTTPTLRTLIRLCKIYEVPSLPLRELCFKSDIERIKRKYGMEDYVVVLRKPKEK